MSVIIARVDTAHGVAATAVCLEADHGDGLIGHVANGDPVARIRDRDDFPVCSNTSSGATLSRRGSVVTTGEASTTESTIGAMPNCRSASMEIDSPAANGRVLDGLWVARLKSSDTSTLTSSPTSLRARPGARRWETWSVRSMPAK